MAAQGATKAAARAFAEKQHDKLGCPISCVPELSAASDAEAIATALAQLLDRRTELTTEPEGKKRCMVQ